jgi:hypothetical protein
MFQRECVVCHNAPSHQGGLDLETDPWSELVGVTSPAYGAVRVEPGDPGGSLLWRKMDGSQGNSEGGVMPPRGVQGADADLVRAWIEAGASESCDPTATAASRIGPPEGRPAAGVARVFLGSQSRAVRPHLPRRGPPPPARVTGGILPPDRMSGAPPS